MKACNKCFYYDNCNDEDKTNGGCEYYYPFIEYESIVLKEYEIDLRMRAVEYCLVEEV